MFGHLLQRLTSTILSEQISELGIPGSGTTPFANDHVGAVIAICFHVHQLSPSLVLRMPSILQLISYVSIVNE